jgi:hypothetical protein
MVLQRMILVQMEAPASMWISKNHTGTNEGSIVYVVLQRIILLQLEIPGSMWFYKE